MNLVSSFQDLADDKRYIQDVQEIIRNRLFYQPTNDFFTIVPNVKGGQQVAAMKGFEYVTKASAGCGGSGVSPVFPAFSQFWDPKLQEVKINYCFTDFMQHFTQWALSNGHDIKNLGTTELAVFIEDLVAEAMALDMQRIVLLGDKDIATQDILTDPVTKAQYYSSIGKGLIPTLQYLKTLPEFQGNFVELNKNTGPVAEQIDLHKTYALDIYEEVLDTYDFDGDILLTSNRLFKNYSKWIKRDNDMNTEENVQRTANGLKDVYVDGQKVSNIVNYDRWRKTDFLIDFSGSGSSVSSGDATEKTIHLPHFALFSRKEYLQVGVDSEAALSDIRLEYIGGSDETFWIKANYMLDFKMVNPYALKAAL